LISQEQKSGTRNPWFIGILALIAVVLSVNATFIWLSTQNRSSLVDRDYKGKDRKTGAAFLDELGTRQALAWKTVINRPDKVVKGVPTEFLIQVFDRDGNPVRGEVTVEAYRAADANQDFATRFKEVSVGSYQELISFPLKGYWELHVRVVRGEDIFTAHTDRFMVAESF
jgi:nitrogen fixation protein FixH